MVTGFLAAYQRMERNVQIFAILLFETFGIFADNLLVFTVSRNQHTCLREYFFQGFHAVDQHIPGAGSHKQFHTAYVCFVQCFQLVGIVVRSPKIERIVDNAFSGCILEFIVQCFECGSLRVAVRHIHERSYSSSRSRSCFGSHVCFVSKSRIAEMHMVIYHSWQQKASLCINFFFTVGSGFAVSFNDLLYLFSFNHHRTGKTASFIYDDCMMYPRTFHKYFLISMFGIFLEPAVPFQLDDTEYGLPKDAAVHFGST